MVFLVGLLTARCHSPSVGGAHCDEWQGLSSCDLQHDKSTKTGLGGAFMFFNLFSERLSQLTNIFGKAVG